MKGAGSVTEDASRAAWLQQARSYLRNADPVLARLIDDRPAFDPRAWMAQLPPMDLYGALLFQVTGQQLSVPAARRTLARIEALFRRPSPLTRPTAEYGSRLGCRGGRSTSPSDCPMAERRGLVRREPDPTDRPFTKAISTEKGFRTLGEAAPGYVAHVRSLIIDVLSPEPLRRLGRDADRIIARRHFWNQPTGSRPSKATGLILSVGLRRSAPRQACVGPRNLLGGQKG
jgi:hypothetical protein